MARRCGRILKGLDAVVIGCSNIVGKPMDHLLLAQDCTVTLAHSRTRQGDIPMRITGTVKFYNYAKGFGFIQPEDGSTDVHVHATALELAGIQTLNEGDKVSFVLEDDRKGRGKQTGRIEQV